MATRRAPRSPCWWRCWPSWSPARRWSGRACCSLTAVPAAGAAARDGPRPRRRRRGRRRARLPGGPGRPGRGRARRGDRAGRLRRRRRGVGPAHRPVRGPPDDRRPRGRRPSCGTCRPTDARCAWRTSPSSTTADARGTLVAGRWPDAPGEVALPTSAARALGLDVGSTTTLAADPGGGGAELTVVGTFVPRPGAAWDEDPLQRDRGEPELPRVHHRLRPVRRRARRARRERDPAAPGHPARAARPDGRDRRRPDPGRRGRRRTATASCGSALGDRTAEPRGGPAVRAHDRTPRASSAG